jgi:hypothetical protein
MTDSVDSTAAIKAELASVKTNIALADADTTLELSRLRDTHAWLMALWERRAELEAEIGRADD